MSFDLKLIDGDLVLKDSKITTIVDTEKLIQDILKLCYTDAGSNVFNPWYGSYLSRVIVGSAMDDKILIDVSKSQLLSSLQNLVQLQQLQIKSFQRISADEQINAITSVEIYRDDSDPTMFIISISALTKGLKPITTQFNITSPF